ncbi:MAG: tetratricopeptide repeat protein [Gammaproteobacteria bacterium]|nr:tetratricopeptide repeat protein [Gammaproteobacteria bacterium]
MPHKAGVFRRRQKAPHHRQALRQGPTLPQLLADALAFQQAGELQQAELLYRRILASYPDQPVALHGLGAIAFQAGHYADARTHFSKAAEADPQDPELHNDLGSVLMESGALDAAERCYRTALALNPAYAEVHYNLGTLLCKQEKLEAAIESFREAVRHKPDYAGAYFNLGFALQEAERLQEAAGAYAKATQLLPYWAEAHKALGDVLHALDKGAAAASAYRSAIRLNPRFAAAHFKLGKVLHEDGCLNEAMASYREALRDDPQMVLAHLNLGTALQELGRLEDAAACYRAANRCKPTAEGYYSLANARRFSRDDEAEIAAMELLSTRDDLVDDSRIHIQFALGKVYDDCALYEAAFAHYERGNQLKRNSLDFDQAEHTDRISRLIATFTADFFKERSALGNESELPVFIIGMPRTCKTLVEAIVSSHPAVYGGGQLPYIHRIVQEMPRLLHTSVAYPESISKIDGGSARAITEGYIKGLRDVSEIALRVTDTLPFNYEHLGLIALLFPKARIIHCRRDPVDVCLSIYFQHFTAQHPFAYDLRDIAHYYHEYQRLMAHWRALWPGRMLEVDYETLVSNQAEMSRRLIDYCGLEWDDRCLAFHKSAPAVHSASSWQVRQPIYNTEIKRWKHYEKHLGVLIDALNAWK